MPVGHQSAYGPKYHFQTRIGGLTIAQAPWILMRAAGFGGTAAVGLMLYASCMPRVQDDILKKIPGLRGFYEKSIHPADNPF